MISWFQAFAFKYNLYRYTTDDVVIEYIGESISMARGDLREAEYERSGMGSTYMFRVDGRVLSLAYNRPLFKPHLSCSNLFTTTNESKYM